MKKLYLPLSVQISIVSSSPSFFHFLLLFLLPLRFFSSLSSSSSFFFLFSLFFSPLNPFERRRAKSVTVPCNFYRRFEIRILETRWIPRKNCSIRDFFSKLVNPATVASNFSFSKNRSLVTSPRLNRLFFSFFLKSYH